MKVNDNIIIEKAKDDNWTCKVNLYEKWKYMYSKYFPIKNNTKKYNGESYIILGIGLGYELNEIIENSSGKILVIDSDRTFFDIALKLNLLEKVIENPRVDFLFGEEYKKYDFKNMKKFEVVNNKNITEFNLKFFFQVIKYFSYININNKKEKIAFYEHITIADDCIEALKRLGYEVIKMKFTSKDKMIQDIVDTNPKYIFSINMSEKISSISELLSIPYISWTVDTPAYSLYDNLLENKNNLVFIYDSDVVKEFKQRKFKNIYYLPVAANLTRLDKVKLTFEDVEKYSCDMSFLGSADLNNDFNKTMFNKLTNETLKKIDDIFSRWLIDYESYGVDSIDDDFLNRLEKESTLNINSQVFMDKKEKIALILGRKFNEIERIKMIKELSNKFNLHVYGGNEWNQLNVKDFIYKGYAEHFNEMPKVFKCSKVNINYTRIYVSSGLPMRVFDVLGSKGFLATNLKEDIKKYFVDGKDLVIYRDVKDLIELTNYYLNNEDERQEIILNGYEKIKKEHNYDVRLKNMMKYVNRYYNLG